jgi:hypothetical protein
VALVSAEALEEHIASIIWVTRIGELECFLSDIVSILRSVLQLLVTANVVPSSSTLVTLRIETIRSSETPVHTRATRCNTSEDGILHSHRSENLKSYIALTYWSL